jgi:hypothetical protein
MKKGKIEVKTTEGAKYKEFNFGKSSGKGTGRNENKHKQNADKETIKMIQEHDEYHFADKHGDIQSDKCKIRRPVYVIRGKEKSVVLKILRQKKGWTMSRSYFSEKIPNYHICFDICKLAKALKVDNQTILDMLKDSRSFSKITEKYVAEATGGNATGVDTEPDVVVENYDPNYLKAIRNDCYPKDESYHLSSGQ